LKELGLTLKFCLETHIHADHITGAGKLRQATGCLGVIPAGAKAACADRFIQNDEVLQMGSIRIEAIATLGHTASHMAYLVNGTPLLTGDYFCRE
jgi:sulfur dioxygenase